MSTFLLKSYVMLTLEALEQDESLDEVGNVALGAPLDGGTSYNPTGNTMGAVWGTSYGGPVLNMWRTDLDAPPPKRARRRKKRRKAD
jgi:hypothetical protein